MFFNRSAGSGTATDNQYYVKGRICLENADIGGRLFLAAQPDRALYRPADPSDDVFVDLGFVRVAGSAHLQILPIQPFAKASLKSARVGSLDVSACAHQWVRWDLEGLRYGAIEKVDEVTPEGNAAFNPDWVRVWTDQILRNAKEIKTVLQGSKSRQNMATVAIQPFDALMAFLRESGRDEAACDVGIAKEQTITDNIKLMRRRKLQYKNRCTTYGRHLLWRKIIDFLASYGYRTYKPVISLVVLILMGGYVFNDANHSYAIFETKFAYYIGNLHTLQNLEHKEAPLASPSVTSPIKLDEYPSFQPFFYSIEVATPILDFGQESHFDIKGSEDFKYYKYYKRFHTFVGWVFSILIMLSPTKLLRRE